MAMSPSGASGRIIVLFRIKGVEIGFTPSWLVMVTLLSLIFRTQVVPPSYGKISGAALAVALTLLFYVFVLLHEGAHTLVAHVFGLQPRRIVLFMLGGVSQIGRDADEPKQEYLVALAGPLTSLCIAGLLTAVTRSTGDDFDFVWGTLATFNLLLAAFNLIPGFPLDGGRVLRSTMWAITGDRIHATQVAVMGGKIVAGGFMAGGVVFMLWTSEGILQGIQGVWIVVLGYFLYSHASFAGREEIEREMIREQARVAADQSALEMAAAIQPAEPAGDIVPELPARRGRKGAAADSSDSRGAGPAARVTLPATATTLEKPSRKAGVRSRKPASSPAAQAIAKRAATQTATGAGNASKSKAKATSSKRRHESDPAKSEAAGGRRRRAVGSRAAAPSGSQSGDGAGHSKKRAADSRGAARRKR